MTTRPSAVRPELDAFDRIVNGWADTPNCEANRNRGAQCRRPARWRLNIHGCQVVLLCTHHLHAWERKAHATMTPYCDHCGQHWPTLTDAYTVSAL